jgi:hypothetical protein
MVKRPIRRFTEIEVTFLENSGNLSGSIETP